VDDNRPPQLILASGSPRRRLLLAMLGVPFEVIVSGVDETEGSDDGIDPIAAVVDRARRKAARVSRIANGIRADEHGAEGLPVLGVDTEVVHDGEVLGKPEDDDDARAMLRRLSSSEIEVISGLVLVSPTDGTWSKASAVSRLAVDELTDETIDAYLAAGEHMDKAGGLAVQGAAKDFVTVTEGSRSNVYGLPLVETAALLAGVGIAVRQQRSGEL
jgi:septum formation protein